MPSDSLVSKGIVVLIMLETSKVSLCILAAALSILIPMGVVLYAVSGGLKATFTTSYIHTVIIFVVLCIFMFKTYCGGGELGSISKVCLPSGCLLLFPSFFLCPALHLHPSLPLHSA